MASPVVEWIAQNVSGMSFCDIGGIGLNGLNERITVAQKGGASQTTMIDFRRKDFPEWDAFRKKASESGANQWEEIDGVNLESRDFPQQVGMFDFVHCMGIIYHAPAPMIMLDNLARITRKLLVVNTVIVPEKIETEKGSLHFPGSQVIFLPGISQEDREIMDAYYQKLLNWPPGRFSTFAPPCDDENASMPWLQTHAASEKHFWGNKGDLSYSPYWFLFTATAFRAAVTMLGFRIRDEASFKGHTLTLFCERA